MAFSTANIRRTVLGDLKVIAGDFTAAAGDASGSITVEGGRVYDATFTISDQGLGPTQSIPWTTAAGTNVFTTVVTVHNRQATTGGGRFYIVYA